MLPLLYLLDRAEIKKKTRLFGPEMRNGAFPPGEKKFFRILLAVLVSSCLLLPLPTVVGEQGAGEEGEKKGEPTGSLPPSSF